MWFRLCGLTAVIVVASFVGVASAQDPQSGPQVGEKVMPFHPLNLTGEHAGEKHCLICENGASPVAIIFARQVTPEVISLIKRIDLATGANKERSMGSFVVFLNDSDSLEKELKDLAKKERIQHTVLTIDNPDGPQHYQIAKDADVTVVLYKEMNVKANRTFRKGKLNDKAIEVIAADLAKVLGK